MPKLAIVGYGKMGHIVEGLAAQFEFEVVAKIGAAKIDAPETKATKPPNLNGAEVAVEFTTPRAVVGNVEWLAKAGVPMVIGTTGWGSELERVKKIIAQHHGSLVWSPNFSIGVNVFSRIIEKAAELLADEDEYGAWAWEMHHAAKQDAPSGTLLKLVEEMRHAGYTRDIHVSSSRAGKAPGTHEIGFDSQADTITLRHAARSREGFARGALKAARWIMHYQGVHEFDEVMWGGK